MEVTIPVVDIYVWNNYDYGQITEGSQEVKMKNAKKAARKKKKTPAKSLKEVIKEVKSEFDVIAEIVRLALLDGTENPNNDPTIQEMEKLGLPTAFASTSESFPHKIRKETGKNSIPVFPSREPKVNPSSADLKNPIKETTSDPNNCSCQSESTSASTNWQTGWDPDNEQYYFYNEILQLSQWELPAGLKMSTCTICHNTWLLTEPEIEAEPVRADSAPDPVNPEPAEEPAVHPKYWKQRYSLFSLFDRAAEQGLPPCLPLSSEEEWFSATPEALARHQAFRLQQYQKQQQEGSSAGKSSRLVVVDGFAGTGQNAIQFACAGCEVMAVEINSARASLAASNAQLYSVAHKVDMVNADFLQIAPTLKADVVFLSPPWGGPQYSQVDQYDLRTMILPCDGFAMFLTALEIAPSVIFYLPRNVGLEQLRQLAELQDPPLPFQVERNYVNNRLKAVTAYYGPIAENWAAED